MSAQERTEGIQERPGALKSSQPLFFFNNVLRPTPFFYRNIVPAQQRTGGAVQARPRVLRSAAHLGPAKSAAHLGPPMSAQERTGGVHLSGLFQVPPHPAR